MVEKTAGHPTSRAEYLERVKELIGEDLVFVSTGNDKLNCHSCRRKVEANEKYVRCCVASNERDKKCSSTWHAERICLGPEKYSDENTRSTPPNPANDGPFKFLEPGKVQWACPICRDICKESRCIMKRNKAKGLVPSKPDDGDSITLPLANSFASSSMAINSPPLEAVQLARTPSSSPMPLRTIQEPAYKKLNKKPSDGSIENVDPAESVENGDTRQGVKRKAGMAKDSETAGDKEPAKARRKSNIDTAGGSMRKKKTPYKPLTPMSQDATAPVDNPNFRALHTEFTNTELGSKLFIREFLLKFGKDLYKIPQVHLKTADNPLLEWKPTFWKNIVMHLLEPLLDETLVDDDRISDVVNICLDNIKKQPADSPVIWYNIRDMLQQVTQYTTIPIQEDWDRMKCTILGDRLKLVEGIIGMLVTGDTFRTHIKCTDVRLRNLREVLRCEIKHEKDRFEKFLETDNAKNVRNLAAEKSFHKRTIETIELKSWTSTRKIDYRYAEPLGMDILGNIYSVYTPLQEPGDGWGKWIICYKPDNIAHPSGYLHASTPVSDDSSEHDISYYAIDGAGEIAQLVKWITCKADKVWEDTGSATSPVRRSESRPNHKFDIFIESRPRDKISFKPRDVVTKESISDLCGKLSKIGKMMAAHNRSMQLRRDNKLL